MFEEKNIANSYREFKKFPSLDPPEAFMRTLEEDEEKRKEAEEDYWQRKYEETLYEYIY